MWSIFSIYTARATREDNPFRCKCFDLVYWRIVRQKFAVYSQVPNSARDKLVVLSPKIENDDNFIWLIHYEPPLIIGFIILMVNSHRQGKENTLLIIGES
ncbi:hypothetical protein D3C71_1350440 [compost metagenome]